MPKFFTGDPQNPYAEAVAIRGNKIVAVGNASEVMKVVSASAERVDLGARAFSRGSSIPIATRSMADSG